MDKFHTVWTDFSQCWSLQKVRIPSGVIECAGLFKASRLKKMLERRNSIRRVFWNLTEKCHHLIFIMHQTRFLNYYLWMDRMPKFIQLWPVCCMHGSRFKEITYSCVLSNWEFFIKVWVPSLLPPPFIARGGRARELSFWWNLSIWCETFVFALSLKENIQNIILGYIKTHFVSLISTGAPFNCWKLSSSMDLKLVDF